MGTYGAISRGFAQEPPPAPPTPQIDIGGLVSGIVQGFQTVLQGWANDLPDQAAQNLTQRTSGFWSSAHTSGANFLTRTPPDWTYNLGQASSLWQTAEPAIYGTVAIAFVLAGLALLGRELAGWDWSPGEHASRIVLAVLLALAMPRLYRVSIDGINAVCDAIGATNVPGPSSTSGQDPLVTAVLVVVWAFLGVRLLVRMAYRLVMLVVLMVVGPLAMLCYAVPQSQWIAKRWTQNYVGWLVGQVLVVAALKLAAALAPPTGGAWAGMLLGIGVLLLAYDLAGLLASSNGGGLLAGAAFVRKLIR